MTYIINKTNLTKLKGKV